MRDNTGWNWLVLLTIAVIVLLVCVWIVFILLSKWTSGLTLG
jgi:hypothetical protein